MKRLILLLLSAILFSSCYTTYHTVGEGVQSQRVFKRKKQATYLLGGLISMNRRKVNAKKLAPAGIENYMIKTQFRVTDWLLTFIANAIIPTSFMTQTVVVSFDDPTAPKDKKKVPTEYPQSDKAQHSRGE